MMKLEWKLNRIRIIICLLVTVGILCFQNSMTVCASSERHLTGDSEISTIIDPPGTYNTPEDLNRLNTANTVTVTYNEGNGQMNGALRILLTLTLIAIAPTLIINYDDKSWQSLLTQLGEITGQEQQAAARIAEFDKQLQAVKQRITLPPQPVSALVYTAAAHSANLWTPESAQGKLMEQLGFTLAPLPAGLHTSQSQGKRHDIIQLGGENLAAGLNGEALFLFAGDNKDADAIYANPLLAHLPAVQNKRVYALGTETFRLDYYSATLLLQRLSALF